jgi:LemA protein
MLWVIVLVVIVVLLLIVLVAMYNRLVRLRNRAENSWAQVDVQLRRRYDLIPNLVEAVKGYASHERSTFDEVTQARTAAQQAQGVEDKAQAENVLTAAIGRLFAVAEAYPQLKANEVFLKLQEQLTDIEALLASARNYYNAVVQRYNTAISVFPGKLLAGKRFQPAEYFQDVPSRSSGPPQVTT